MILPLSRWGTLLVAGAILFFGAVPARAQFFPRYLEDIKVLAGREGESLRLKFSTRYEGRPKATHEPGRFSLDFSVTGSKVTARNVRIPEGKLFRAFHVVQNRSSTTLTVKLKDPKTSMQGRLEFFNEGDVFRVRALPPVPDPATARDAEHELRTEMTRRIAGEGALVPLAGGTAQTGEEGAEPLALGGFRGIDWFPTMLTMVLGLGAIVLGLYLVMFVYNRFVAVRLNRKNTTHNVRQLASFHIGPKQRIVVLDINGDVLACGVTPSQITFLTRLAGRGPRSRPGPSDSTAPRGGPPSGAPPGGGGQRTEPVPKREDPVQQFAEALKDKVRSLKRIK